MPRGGARPGAGRKPILVKKKRGKQIMISQKFEKFICEKEDRGKTVLEKLKIITKFNDLEVIK